LAKYYWLAVISNVDGNIADVLAPLRN
jgi:hypothetical protein